MDTRQEVDQFRANERRVHGRRALALIALGLTTVVLSGWSLATMPGIADMRGVTRIRTGTDVGWMTAVAAVIVIGIVLAALGFWNGAKWRWIDGMKPAGRRKVDRSPFPRNTHFGHCAINPVGL